MRKTLTAALFVFITAAFFQCSPATDRKVAIAEEELERDISEERRDVIKDLRWLRDDVPRLKNHYEMPLNLQIPTGIIFSEMPRIHCVR